MNNIEINQIKTYYDFCLGCGAHLLSEQEEKKNILLQLLQIVIIIIECIKSEQFHNNSWIRRIILTNLWIYWLGKSEWREKKTPHR